METVPCLVKTCVSFRSPTSGFGYCPIHHRVATNRELFTLALRGSINQPLKDFAEEIERGTYPNAF